MRHRHRRPSFPSVFSSATTLPWGMTGYRPHGLPWDAGGPEHATLAGTRVTVGGEQKINRSARWNRRRGTSKPTCPSPERRSHPRARSHWWASVPGGIVCSIRAPSLAGTVSSTSPPRADLASLIDSLKATQRVLEMFRRSLAEDSPRPLLGRLARRLAKILAEAARLTPPQK